MKINNITNPGKPLKDGDWVEYHHGNGSIERKQYHPQIDIKNVDLRLNVDIKASSSFTAIKNNGIEEISIKAVLTYNGEPYIMNKIWQVPIVDRHNNVYDIIPCQFIDGVCETEYKTTKAPNICQISQNDILPLEIDGEKYPVRLTGNTMFMVHN